MSDIPTSIKRFSEKKPVQLDAKKVAKIRANFKPKGKKIVAAPGTEGGGDTAGMVAFSRAINRAKKNPYEEVRKEISELSDDERDGLNVYYHKDGPKFWVDQMDWHEGDGGKKVIAAAEKSTSKKSVDGYKFRSKDDLERYDFPKGAGVYVFNESSPPKDWEDMTRRKMSRIAGQVKRYAETSTDLAALLARARSDPYDPTLHGAIADALEEHMPGNKLSDLIRRQYGQGQYGGRGEANNLWHEPFYAGYDGTHPYAARLGRHGPFDLYLLHEGGGTDFHNDESANPNQRWILRAASRLRGSNDTAYNFEFPHEEAHLIPQMFPHASNYISRDINEDKTSAYHPDNDRLAHSVERNREANEFKDRMYAEEASRG